MSAISASTSAQNAQQIDMQMGGVSLDEYMAAKPNLMKEFRKNRGNNSAKSNKKPKVTRATPKLNRSNKSGQFMSRSSSFSRNASQNSSFGSRMSFVGKTKARQSFAQVWKRDKFNGQQTRQNQNYNSNSSRQTRNSFSNNNSINNSQNSQRTNDVVISNLPKTVTNNLLRKVLSSCSGYLHSNLHLSSNGTPTGFADAKFATYIEAKKAQGYLNGQLLNGTKIAATVLSSNNSSNNSSRSAYSNNSNFSQMSNSSNRGNFNTQRNFNQRSPRQQNGGNFRQNNSGQSFRPNRASNNKIYFRTNNFNGQNRKASGVQKKKSMPSQDQLDLELEAYKKGKK